MRLRFSSVALFFAACLFAACLFAACATPTQPGHVEIITAPDGDVASWVAEQVTRARSDQKQLLVYVGATWCEPCQRFHQAAHAGKLDGAFPRLRLLDFDHDRDGERLAVAGYTSKLIPLFAIPAASGRASGRQMEGSVKGAEAVANIAPRLSALLVSAAP